jgi:uncharacterized membrane protein
VSGLSAILKELAGLFVDDGALALAIVAVVVFAGVVAALAPDARLVSGGILLLGCLTVLFVNAMRAGRR